MSFSACPVPFSDFSEFLKIHYDCYQKFQKIALYLQFVFIFCAVRIRLRPTSDRRSLDYEQGGGRRKKRGKFFYQGKRSFDCYRNRMERDFVFIGRLKPR